jgi:hypothetical protein
MRQMQETTIVLVAAVAFVLWAAAFLLMYSLCVAAAHGDHRLRLAAPDPGVAGPPPRMP